MQRYPKYVATLIVTALGLMAAIWVGLNTTTTAQASPSYDCSPPICSFDPKTGRITCTKICKSTPPPAGTPPPRGTNPPPGATKTPSCVGLACGTPVGGTPVATPVPCTGNTCPTATAPPTPCAGCGGSVTVCYGIAQNPPVPDWATWVAEADRRGYDGVLVQVTFVTSGSPLFEVIGFCLPVTPTKTPAPTAVPTNPPCPVVISGSGITLSCSPYYNEISVSADVPCMEAGRSPAPRALVSVDNLLWLVPGVGENGNFPESWSDTCWPIPNDPVENHPYNYRIGVRWKRLTDRQPEWDFDERPWNAGRSGSTAEGMSVLHAYESASFGLAANGPGLDGAFNLPAYQVRAHTYWMAEWAQAWEYFTWECPEGKERDDGNGPYCTAPEIQVWHSAFDGWHFIDLTRYGNPTYYFDSTRVQSPDVRVMPAKVCLPVIPVPVIESQAVIGH